LIPMGCVAPMASGSLEEAERCLQQGVRGLGELAVYHACDALEALRAYGDLIQCCRSFGGILLVHANEPIGHVYPGKAPFGLDFYYALARLCEGMTLILAHWGGGLGFYELLKKEVPEALSNVYYDTAASPFLYQPAIYRMMSGVLRSGKILLGSDFPLLSPERYFREIAEAGISLEEAEGILGANAARLFDLMPSSQS
jgi:uncharacterized protein